MKRVTTRNGGSGNGNDMVFEREKGFVFPNQKMKRMLLLVIIYGGQEAKGKKGKGK